MHRVNKHDIALVRDLYFRILNAKATGLEVQDYLDFIRVRKLVFQSGLKRRSEFEIIKLLTQRMAGAPCPYSPRSFIEFDYDELKPHEAQECLNSLRQYFADLADTGSNIALNGLTRRIDELMPAKTQQDISFGVEALYSLMSVSLGENVMKEFKGPNQSGEVDEDNVQ